MKTDTAGSIDIAAVDSIVERALRMLGTPGASVAIVKDNDVYVQGYGTKEVGKDEQVTPDTLFALASVTKAFTTAAMAILVDEGKMKWDDHPREHLPFFKLSDPVADANVTLRDLVSHRTGMPRHDFLWYATDWSNEELVRRYGLAPSTQPFRSCYQYTNILYEAAGLAVGAVSGGTWAQFVKDRVFKPLGMENAITSAKELASKADCATPHVRNKTGLIAIPWYDEGGREAACGGIAASARDMSKWLQLQLNYGEFEGKRIISVENLKETHKPHAVIPFENPDRFGFDNGIQMISYCMGWALISYRGKVLVMHNGQIDGFTSSVVLSPRDKTGFVVLVNHSGAGTIDSITNSLTDFMFGLEKKDWNRHYKDLTKAVIADFKAKERQTVRPKGGKPSRKLEAYVGKYEHPAYGTIDVSLTDGKLNVTYYQLSASLKHYHFDTFVGKHDSGYCKWDVKVHFSLNQNGEIALVRVLEPFEAEFQRCTLDT